MWELDLESLLEFLLRKGREGGRSRQGHKALQLETTQLSLHWAADILWKALPCPRPAMPGGWGSPSEPPVATSVPLSILLSPEMVVHCVRWSQLPTTLQ